MHSCPRCGMACDCSGDWDDIEVMSPEWVFKNCQCECEEFSDDDDDYDDDDYDEAEYYQCLGCGWTGAVDPGQCPRCCASAISGVY